MWSRVAARLKAQGVRCFYNADEQTDLLGRYLAEELPAIYAEQSGAVVVFVSAEYAERDWTRLERRSAINRAVRERREYVLPARFEGTALPGLLSDLVALDLSHRPPETFADLVLDKLVRLGIVCAAAAATAPASDAEPADLRRLLRGENPAEQSARGDARDRSRREDGASARSAAGRPGAGAVTRWPWLAALRWWHTCMRLRTARAVGRRTTT
jgi:hypothetical protein